MTRSDFDGLSCAALLMQAGVVDDFLYTHPKDIQDGRIEVTENDVLANVPFMPGCGLWFDHHSSEEERLERNLRFEGASRPAPSCARVVYEYYRDRGVSFPAHLEDLVTAVDKLDSAQLSHEEILHPAGWVLLGYIMDPRTGLGRIHTFRISNFDLMKRMPELCRTLTADQILKHEDVAERAEVYFQQADPFRKMLENNSESHGPLVVLDLLDQDPIHAGNRFMLYDMYPECNISMTLLWGFRKQNVVFSVGHSILNRTSKVNVGRLMLEYDGGGHNQVGTCQVPVDRGLAVKAELIEKIRASS